MKQVDPAGRARLPFTADCRDALIQSVGYDACGVWRHSRWLNLVLIRYHFLTVDARLLDNGAQLS